MSTPPVSPQVSAAIRGTCARLGLAAETEAEVHRVLRLDRAGEGYLLVVFGPAEGALGIAAFEPTTGSVQGSARLAGTTRALPLDAAAARGRAGAEPQAPAGLVWQPSPASMSPLLPFWQVRTGDGKVTYVDQQGRTFTEAQLRVSRPGG